MAGSSSTTRTAARRVRLGIGASFQPGENAFPHGGGLQYNKGH
jgi:hypothetical protein